jgi:DNA-directed RNA polymerase subunit RPC12/RpoP
VDSNTQGATGRCAECGEALDPQEKFSSPKGAVCKWCDSERQVKVQQASAPKYSPTYSPQQSSGMSGLTILRLCLVGIGILVALARHC